MIEMRELFSPQMDVFMGFTVCLPSHHQPKRDDQTVEEEWMIIIMGRS